MIRNDLHVHSVQSMCGMHTVLEIVEIAARKGMRLVNISDHGSASGKVMRFGVIANKLRWPEKVESSTGHIITMLAGIETNILDVDGSSDFPQSDSKRFDLVNAGFHHANHGASGNTKALENYLAQTPLDILTHPCKASHPLLVEEIVELSLAYGFALEVNNTNLRVGKTDHEQLEKMIVLASERGARLVENSDGHTLIEIGENEKVEAFLAERHIPADGLFLNRDDLRLEQFLTQRKQKRTSSS